MNTDSIRSIVNSPLWEKITKNKHYLNHIAFDTKSKYPEQRESGQHFVMLVFFNHEISNSTLKKYHLEGRKYQCGENLDAFVDPPYNFYGAVTMLQFS